MAELTMSSPTVSSESFTVFPKLVVELRLKVWRSAFPPPRHVKLDLSYHFCEHDISPEIEAMQDHDLSLPLPVTLFVNHESREETLRHYIVVWRSNMIDTVKGYIEKPFCLDPSCDSVYFYSTWAHMEYQQGSLNFYRWVIYLSNILSKAKKSIRYLEYLDDHFGAVMWGIHPRSKWIYTLPKLLLDLPLEALCITISTSEDDYLYPGGWLKFLHSEEGKTVTEKNLKAWLEEAYSDGKLPKVLKFVLKTAWQHSFTGLHRGVGKGPGWVGAGMKSDYITSRERGKFFICTRY
ncbi:hypothetical protein N431DRAFT_564235 [Stipitochalara longipes BDJ]|nr:hypothetical protein N431DRAFT_564235 [Stipitochalara longipes BDJ]